MGGGADGHAVALNERGVVHADLQDDHLGRGAVERAMVEAPEDVFHAVTADTEVHGFEAAEMFLPGGIEGRAVETAAPALGDTVSDERDIDGAGGFDVGDVLGVVGEPDITISRILAAPASGGRGDEPHLGQMLLDLVSGLAGVFFFIGPSYFGFGQRPTRQLRVELAVVVRGVGVEQRFTVRGLGRRSGGRSWLVRGC